MATDEEKVNESILLIALDAMALEDKTQPVRIPNPMTTYEHDNPKLLIEVVVQKKRDDKDDHSTFSSSPAPIQTMFQEQASALQQRFLRENEGWLLRGLCCTDFDLYTAQPLRFYQEERANQDTLMECVYAHGHVLVHSACPSIPSREAPDVDLYLVSIQHPESGKELWPKTWINRERLTGLVLHALSDNLVYVLRDPFDYNLVPTWTMDQDRQPAITIHGYEDAPRSSFSQYVYRCRLNSASRPGQPESRPEGGQTPLPSAEFLLSALEINNILERCYVSNMHGQLFRYGGVEIGWPPQPRPHVTYMPHPNCARFTGDYPVIDAYPLPEELRTNDPDDNMRRSLFYQEVIETIPSDPDPELIAASLGPRAGASKPRRKPAVLKGPPRTNT